MTRLQITAVLGVVVVAIAGLAIAGARVLDRDRAAMQAEFAEVELGRLEDAALELSRDFEKIAEDLDLALVLAGTPGPTAVLERELAAVATLTREYLGWELRELDGTVVLRVEAPDAPAGAMDRHAQTIAETIAASARAPGVVKTSRAAPTDPWIRVLARTGPAGDRARSVAVVVDTRPMLSKLRLVRDPGSALLVLGAHGAPAPVSDDALAAAARGEVGALPRFAAMVADMRAQRQVVTTLSEREAATLGLPRAAAVAVTVAARIEDGDPWTLALVASTARLRSQERRVVRRMVVGVGVLGALLVVIAGYVVHSARRSATLRERARAAERLAEHLGQVQRLEDQLLRSEKLATAGVLSAGIAHEIGTPLNVARGRAELTAARLGADHPHAASQRLIIDQIDHVTRLIGQLLDYVRPQPVAVQPVAPRAALDGVAALLGAEAQGRGVTLDVEVAAGAPALLADPGQLQQVVVNLVMNAIQACEAGGHVRIRATRGGDGAAVLEVIDDGCGIPREHHARVFDPFFTTKKRGKGTGLGLAIVDQLVRSHGATLAIDSEPGRGTLVRLTWPAAGSPQP